MNNTEILNTIKNQFPEINAKLNEPLKNHTYIKTGGNADIYILPTTIEEVQTIITYAHESDIPLTILGYGSNVLIRDEGIRGIVLNLGAFNEISLDGTSIKCGCGASIIDVSRFALQNELTGLEFACGIPGSVGGALVMNAGAYGGEVSYVLKSATVLTTDGKLMTLTKGEFQFGYRKSVFAKENYIVLEAEFELQIGNVNEIKEKMDEFTLARETKQPLEYPSCGSVFKRPPNNFAGKLISDSGLKGKRIGGVEVSTKHAGFMVNVDNATTTDYLNLIQFVQDTVKEKFGIELEREVKILGGE